MDKRSILTYYVIYNQIMLYIIISRSLTCFDVRRCEFDTLCCYMSEKTRKKNILIHKYSCVIDISYVCIHLKAYFDEDIIFFRY